MKSLQTILEFLQVKEWRPATEEEQTAFMSATNSVCLLIGFFTDAQGQKGYIEKNPLSPDYDSRYIRVHYGEEWTIEGPSLRDLGLELINPAYKIVYEMVPEADKEEIEKFKYEDPGTLIAYLYGKYDLYTIDKPDKDKAEFYRKVINKALTSISENDFYLAHQIRFIVTSMKQKNSSGTVKPKLN